MIGVGFSMDLSNLKRNFFDRAAVKNAVDRTTVRVLSKFGSFVRRRARQSIKRAPKTLAARARRGISAGGISAPGMPPVSHDQDLLKKFILFSYEPGRRSVVVGPAKLSGRIGNAPEALEHGGESQALESFWTGTGPNRVRQRRLVRTRVRARPFMIPALNAELPGLPAMWSNSIR